MKAILLFKVEIYTRTVFNNLLNDNEKSRSTPAFYTSV